MTDISPEASDIPLFSECVVGFRQWQLHEWVLAPLSIGAPWRPGVNTAQCYRDSLFDIERKEHSSPEIGCGCGFHALFDLPQRVRSVTGAIAAWGDLAVHHDGFRAQHVQILGLMEVPGGGLDEVRDFYGVPLLSPYDLVKEAHRHAQPLPKSLRPPIPPLVENVSPFGMALRQAYLPSYVKPPPASPRKRRLR